MSLAAKLVLALCLFMAGGAVGIKWQLGVQARAELDAQHARESDALQQRKFSDKKASDHAADLATINNQLGDAREKIAQLSGRQCLDSGTVGVLNAIGGDPVPTSPSQFASAAEAAPTGGGLRFATDRDTARAIAICRARYAEVTGQLNDILDIEDRRQAD